MCRHSLPHAICASLAHVVARPTACTAGEDPDQLHMPKVQLGLRQGSLAVVARPKVSAAGDDPEVGAHVLIYLGGYQFELREVGADAADALGSRNEPVAKGGIHRVGLGEGVALLDSGGSRSTAPSAGKQASTAQDNYQQRTKKD